MMSLRKNVVRLCGVVGTLLWLGTAGAAPLTGTFQGYAANAGGPDWTVQNGDPVSGTFYLDTAGIAFGPGAIGPGYTWFSYYDAVNPLYPLRFTFSAPAGVYTMDSYILNIVMYDDGRLRLNADAPGTCCAATLDLYAAPGALFDALDPTTIHAGPIDLAASSASYYTHSYPNFDVVLTAFSFDGASSVPEPGSLWLVGAAVAAAGVGARRRAVRPGRPS